jgi:hypothetical protein
VVQVARSQGLRQLSAHLQHGVGGGHAAFLLRSAVRPGAAHAAIVLDGSRTLVSEDPGAWTP